MKKIIGLFIYLFVSSSIAGNASACAQALPTTHPEFCKSFKSIALCHCKESLPDRACTDMKFLYGRMTGLFGSLKKACDFQKDTPSQTCIDDWKCYLSGGSDSQGGLCSSSGSACE